MPIIEGKLFNWDKKSVFANTDDIWVRSISFHNDGDWFSCTWDNNIYDYDNDHNELIISSFNGFERNGLLFINSIKIFCDFDLAETIVFNYAKANKFKIAPLYKK